MTIDKRLEALGKRLGALARLHEDLEMKVDRRLTNIAAAHYGTLDDHESRIKDLEG